MLGVLLIVVGGVMFLLENLGFGKLPGDIVIKRGNTRIYIPIGTSIFLSLLGTILLNLIFFIIGRR
jgi:hypothetical protein